MIDFSACNLTQELIPQLLLMVYFPTHRERESDAVSRSLAGSYPFVAEE